MVNVIIVTLKYPQMILVFDINTMYGGVRGNYYPPPPPPLPPNSSYIPPESTSPVYAPIFCRANIYKTYPPILPNYDLWKYQLPIILSVGLGKTTPQLDAYAIGRCLMGVELVKMKLMNGLQLTKHPVLTVPGLWVGQTVDSTSH